MVCATIEENKNRLNGDFFYSICIRLKWNFSKSIKRMSINYQFDPSFDFADHFFSFCRWTFRQCHFYVDRIVFTVIRRRTINELNQFASEKEIFCMTWISIEMTCADRDSTFWSSSSRRQWWLLSNGFASQVSEEKNIKINRAPILHRTFWWCKECATRVHPFMASAEMQSTAKPYCLCWFRPRWLRNESRKLSTKSMNPKQCEIVPIKMQINLVMKIVERFKYGCVLHDISN